MAPGIPGSDRRSKEALASGALELSIFLASPARFPSLARCYPSSQSLDGNNSSHSHAGIYVAY